MYLVPFATQKFAQAVMLITLVTVYTICFNVNKYAFCQRTYIYAFCKIFRINNYYFLNSTDSLTFVMEKQCVSCKVGTELLNIL
jgi:hypothetical protein